jgi:very-short-patch-repair endonuclease
MTPRSTRGSTPRSTRGSTPGNASAGAPGGTRDGASGGPSHREVGGTLRSRARALRREMAEPERRFWHAVRDHRFHGLGFRRQVPIAGYVADFVCHELRLVVEIDGATHADAAAVERDRLRTARLEAEGYRALRFWNNEIMDNLDGVLDRLGEIPGRPGPSLVRGKG